MAWIYEIPGYILLGVTKILGVVEWLLNWARSHLEALANYPASSLPGLRWYIWLLAIILIVATLLYALYRLIPNVKRVIFDAYAWVTNLNFWDAIKAIAMIAGWFFAAVVAMGVVSRIFLLIIPYIPPLF